MKGFISLTHYNTNEKFTVGLHAISVISIRGTHAMVAITQGQGSTEYEVSESYDAVVKLVAAAQ